MRAKAIAKLGFGYDEVAAINPAIVYTNCYGYGRRGPDRDRPAYDDTEIQAECGLPAVQQQLTGEARLRRNHHGRQGRRADGAVSTTMALFHRAHRGKARKSRSPCSKPWPRSCSLNMPTARCSILPGAGRVSAPIGTRPPSVSAQQRPHRRVDLQRRTLGRVHQRRAAPWAGRAVFATRLEQRARQIDTIYGLVAETMKQRSTQEWLALFRELEIPAARLNTLGALFDDPHLNAVGMFETVDTPHGPVRFPGVPTWFSRTPGRVAGPAPELGADTAEVLAEIDTSRRKIARNGLPEGDFRLLAKERSFKNGCAGLSEDPRPVRGRGCEYVVRYPRPELRAPVPRGGIAWLGGDLASSSRRVRVSWPRLSRG